MFGTRAHRRWRLPAAIRRALPLAPREHVLAWSTCRSGCGLVATRHGLWEWPPDDPPTRHCWRAIDLVRRAPGRLAIRAEPHGEAHCRHELQPGSTLLDLVRAMDASSRLVELAFRLPSHSTVKIHARTCSFEGSIAWTTRLEPAPGADRAADAILAQALLQRARREFGSMAVSS